MECKIKFSKISKDQETWHLNKCQSSKKRLQLQSTQQEECQSPWTMTTKSTPTTKITMLISTVLTKKVEITKKKWKCTHKTSHPETTKWIFSQGKLTQELSKSYLWVLKRNIRTTSLKSLYLPDIWCLIRRAIVSTRILIEIINSMRVDHNTGKM